MLTRPSCARHVRPLHWTWVTRMTTGQGDFNVVVDQSGQDDEDYQGVVDALSCSALYWALVGCSRLHWAALSVTALYVGQ